jgi:hypothetical protein
MASLPRAGDVGSRVGGGEVMRGEQARPRSVAPEALWATLPVGYEPSFGRLALPARLDPKQNAAMQHSLDAKRRTLR